jgi:aromatic ring-opening dioxygenase LigB subunit
MSLVFAAITPHPPLLIPTIGKGNLKKLQKTKLALEKLEEELYLSKPELLIIISPHTNFLEDSFTLNICSEFNADLKEFGDLTTKLTLKGEMGLAALLRENAKKENIPITLVSEKTLNYGAVVPLVYLTAHLPQVAVLPVSISGLDAKTHLDFGYFLKEQIMNHGKRVAVIASGDLSQTLTPEAPAGFNPAGKQFDETIQQLLSNKNSAGMLQLSEEIIVQSANCGFKTFLILMGVLRSINCTYKSYCYEAPFGVGYLTANFVL